MRKMESNKSFDLIIEGMHCAGCVSTVEKALKGVQGVQSAVVNLILEKATIKGEPDFETLTEAVKSAGYVVVNIDGGDKDITSQISENVRKQSQRAKQNMLLSWCFTLPVMILMFVEMVYGFYWFDKNIFHFGLIFMNTVVLFFPGKETLKSAFISTLHKNPNMDVLIALGSLSALSTGFIQYFIPIHSFVGISGMIMAFHLSGRYIEMKARGRSSDAVRKLMNLEAKKAIVVNVKGEESFVSVKELQLGQIMIVRAGEKIPTDGVVLDGSSAVEESMVSGESLPVTKGIGDDVIGGTICADGTLKVEVTKVGKETFLSQIITMVENAQNTKVPIQIIADKVVSVFVPIVLCLSFLGFLVWYIFPGVLNNASEMIGAWIPWSNLNLTRFGSALFVSIAVLVIACPCALGLATPTALMVGSGLGAEHGILIRSGETIQKMKDVTTIFFDKTGTITEGQPKVVNIQSTGYLSNEELVRIAASVGKESTHPLAKAIVRLADEKNHILIPAKNIKVTPGKGISGLVDGNKVKMGNAEFVSTDENRTELTTVYVSIDKNMAGFFEFEDPIKRESSVGIKKLKEIGIHCVMLTGDRREVAEKIGKFICVSDLHAEGSPLRKKEIVSQYQKRGDIVAMVGDGINDAPALTQADVGIAIGTGTDIAMETGDIVLVKGSLLGVVRTTILAKAIFRKIKQNLFWAFIYNIISIPFAFLGLLHPVIAECAMALSSIIVVGNSNHLRRKQLN